MSMRRPSLPPSGFHPLSLKRAPVRLAASGIAGLVTYFSFAGAGPAVQSVAAWDVAAFVLLGSVWQFMLRANPSETRRRAASDDPGRTAVWLLVLVSSTVSLFAAAVVLRQAHTLAPGRAALWIALCLGAVLAAWLLTQTSWTLRYAHLYYRDGQGSGGLSFPNDDPQREPDDLDFAYFAFTVGMCFQVSDVTVQSPVIRRSVLFHACQSFAFNTAIVALALNLAFGFLA